MIFSALFFSTILLFAGEIPDELLKNLDLFLEYENIQESWIAEEEKNDQKNVDHQSTDQSHRSR